MNFGLKLFGKMLFGLIAGFFLGGAFSKGNDDMAFCLAILGFLFGKRIFDFAFSGSET